LEAKGADPGCFVPERLLHGIDRLIDAARLSDLAPVAEWLQRREALASATPVISTRAICWSIGMRSAASSTGTTCPRPA
jgi:hypothetical protein